MYYKQVRIRNSKELYFLTFRDESAIERSKMVSDCYSWIRYLRKKINSDNVSQSEIAELKVQSPSYYISKVVVDDQPRLQAWLVCTLRLGFEDKKSYLRFKLKNPNFIPDLLKGSNLTLAEDRPVCIV